MDEKLKLLKSADSRNFYLKNRTTRTTIEIEFVFKESNFIRTEINVLMIDKNVIDHGGDGVLSRQLETNVTLLIFTLVLSVIIELNGGASGGEFPLGSVKCLSL